MKKGFTKFFITLCLAVPSLIGCSFGKPTNNNSPASSSVNNNGNNNNNNNGGGNNNNTNVNSSTSPFGGISDIIPDIENVEIGKINNTPVTKYQEATERRIEESAKLLYGGSSTYYSEDGQDIRAIQMKAYMIDLGVGDELAVKFCDFVDGMYEVSYVAAQTYDKEKLGENSKKVQDLYNDALVILNSLDFTRAATLLENINADYKAGAQDDIKAITLESYVAPELYNLNYSNYKTLVANKNKFNNQKLNAALDGYAQFLENYQYSEYRVADYNRYIENLQSIAQKGVIPSYYISFIRKHANEAKDLLLKDIKIILDAYYSVYADVLDYAEKFATVGSLRYQRNDSYTYFVNDYSDIVKMIKEIINKTDVIKLLETIIANEKLGDLLIDTTLEIIVPLLKEWQANDQEKLALVNRLETRLKGLSGRQIKTVVNFALKLAKKVDLNEVAELIARCVSYSYDRQQDKTISEYIIELGDKYINDLDSVIASTTAEEKNTILSVSSIFGLDILNELQSFSRIYHGKDISTEEGWSRLGSSLGEWASAMGEKFYNEIGCLFIRNDEGSNGHSGYYDDPSYGGDPEINGDNYSLRYNNFSANIHVGDQINKSAVYFDYREWGENYSIDLYGNYEEAMTQIERAKQELTYYSQQPEEYVDEYEYASLSALASLTIDVDISMDTSKAATGVPYTVTLTVNGHTLTKKGNATVFPQNFVQLIRMNPSIGKNYSQYTLEDNLLMNYSVLFKGSSQEVTFGYSLDPSPIALDTRETGWHLYIDDSLEYELSYFMYYVVDKNTLKDHLTYSNISYGVYLEGDDSWSSWPYVEYRYKYEDCSFSVYKSLDFDRSYVENKATNKKYSVTVDGLEYEYIIIDNSDPAYIRYSFELQEDFETIVTPTTKTAIVNMDYEYHLSIDGVMCYANKYVYLENQPLTNFTCINDVVKFDYKGTTYRFVKDY